MTTSGARWGCTNKKNPKYRQVRKILLDYPWASDREVASRVGWPGSVQYYTRGMREALGIERLMLTANHWITIVDRDVFNAARRKSHKDSILHWESITRPIGVEVYWKGDPATPLLPRTKTPKIVVPQVYNASQPTMDELLKMVLAEMKVRDIASFTINSDGSVVQVKREVTVVEFTVKP